MTLDPGQIWPVQRADKPACGVAEHDHPQFDYFGCCAAMVMTGPGMQTPMGALTALGHGLKDEWWQRGGYDHAAFHRAMCETPYTSFRDVDKAWEIAAAAETRAADYRAKGLAK